MSSNSINDNLLVKFTNYIHGPSFEFPNEDVDFLRLCLEMHSDAMGYGSNLSQNDRDVLILLINDLNNELEI